MDPGNMMRRIRPPARTSFPFTLYPTCVGTRMDWCGRGDSNPHGPCGPTDFLTSYGFRRRPTGVRGLDYPFTMPRQARSRCRPSSLYTFPVATGRRAWLGIAILQGSPNLSGSTSRISPRALRSSSKSGASTNFATPAAGVAIVGRGIRAKEDMRFAGEYLVHRRTHARRPPGAAASRWRGGRRVAPFTRSGGGAFPCLA